MHLPGELLCAAAALLREVPQVHVITQPHHSTSEFSNEILTATLGQLQHILLKQAVPF
jgi:hypothetical protein